MKMIAMIVVLFLVACGGSADKSQDSQSDASTGDTTTPDTNTGVDTTGTPDLGLDSGQPDLGIEDSGTNDADQTSDPGPQCQEDDRGVDSSLVTSAPAITLSTDFAAQYKALQLCKPSDAGTYEDWFHFKSGTAGVYTIAVGYTPAGTCFDIQVYTALNDAGLVDQVLDSTGSGSTTLELTLAANTDYYVRVWGWNGVNGCADAEDPAPGGPYSLLVTQKTESCGDGKVEAPEVCDKKTNMPVPCGDQCQSLETECGGKNHCVSATFTIEKIEQEGTDCTAAEPGLTPLLNKSVSVYLGFNRLLANLRRESTSWNKHLDHIVGHYTLTVSGGDPNGLIEKVFQNPGYSNRLIFAEGFSTTSFRTTEGATIAFRGDPTALDSDGYPRLMSTDFNSGFIKLIVQSESCGTPPCTPTCIQTVTLGSVKSRLRCRDADNDGDCDLCNSCDGKTKTDCQGPDFDKILPDATCLGACVDSDGAPKCTSEVMTNWTSVELDISALTFEIGSFALSDGDMVATISGDGDPVLLVSDKVLPKNVRMTTDFQIPADYPDDDAFGFVFGYQDASHFYLLEWRKGSTDLCLGGSPAQSGLRLRRIAADSPLGCEDVIISEDNSVGKTLHSLDVPWKTDAWYRVRVDHRPGFIEVEILEQGVFHITKFQVLDASYSSGKFGLFGAYLADGIRYGNVTFATLPDWCGNGKLDPGEDCEPTQSNDPTCSDTCETLPTLAINSPTGGSVVKGNTVTLDLTLTDFSIVDKPGSPVKKGEGLYHIYVDDVYVDYWSTSATDVLVPAMDVGKHTIRIELAGSDHVELGVGASVEVTMDWTYGILLPPSSPNPINSSTVQVLPSVSNFTLDGANIGGVNQPGKGHYHIYLDGTYQTATADSGPWLFGLDPGPHIIQVVLAENDHTELGILDWQRIVVADKRPEIKIISPPNGEIVGSSFTVSVAIENFTLDPNNVGGNNSPGSGHWHVFIDGAYWKESTGTSVNLTGVPAGEHKLRVELINNDHTDLADRCFHEIQISVQ